MSAWDRVSSKGLGFEGLRRCDMCKTNRHYRCVLHVNDGAVDALDFINVRCDCPCEGEVREKGGLIKLVYDLRKTIVNYEQARALVAKAVVLTDTYVLAFENAVREFLVTQYDEEGDLCNTVEENIDAFLHAFHQLEDTYEKEMQTINDQTKGQK